MRRSFGDGLRGRDGVTPAPSALQTFLDALWSAGGSGNFRALWLPTAADTTTNTDPSSPSRVWTYDANIAARITAQGSGVLVSFASASSQYATTPDTADLSITTGGMTIAVLANVTNTAAVRALFTKMNGALSTGEYELSVSSLDLLTFDLTDQSVPVSVRARAQAAITMGATRLFFATCADAAGGATTANGMEVFEGSSQFTSTKTNQATFVAMENTNLVAALGAGNAQTANFMDGSMGLTALWAVVLTAAQKTAVINAVNTYFGLALT